MLVRIIGLMILVLAFTTSASAQTPYARAQAAFDQAQQLTIGVVPEGLNRAGHCVADIAPEKIYSGIACFNRTSDPILGDSLAASKAWDYAYADFFIKEDLRRYTAHPCRYWDGGHVNTLMSLSDSDLKGGGMTLRRARASEAAADPYWIIRFQGNFPGSGPYTEICWLWVDRSRN